MPQVLLKLLQLCQNESSNIAQLTELIAQDAACSAKVIAAANAASRATATRITRLDQCLVHLGRDAIKTLVISESVFQVFNAFAGARTCDLRRFWCHTLTTAILAKELAEACHYPHSEEAYLAGLMHDVGRLGLLAATPEHYTPLFLRDDMESLCEIEQQRWQTTHAVVGAWLVDQWQLDNFIADSVCYHHEDPAALLHAHPLIRITHVANRLAQVLYQHPIDRDAILRAEQAAELLCSVDAPYCRSIGNTARTQVLKTASRLGIDVSSVYERFAESLDPDATQLLPVWRDEAATQQALNEAVQNMVLCQLAQLQLVPRSEVGLPSDAELLGGFAHTLNILFGLSCPLAFVREGGQHLARGLPLASAHAHLAQLTAPLQPAGCAVSRAMQAERLIEIDAAKSGHLLDRQLLDQLSADRLWCLPLRSHGDSLGVFLLQPGEGALQAVPEPLLLALASQAGAGLAALREQREQQRLQQHEQAAVYRQHSRAIVHEVNNPLSIIKNYLSLLASKLAESPVVPAEALTRELGIIRDEINRVGNILTRLGGPLPTPSCRPHGFDVAELLEEVASFFEELVLANQAVPAQIQLMTRVEPQLPAVQGDRHAIKQVLLNLVKNALEALAAEPGTVCLEAAGLINRDGMLYVELLVRDSGPGIDPALLGSLFQPVRSRKGGQHQGLGLTIVKELMDEAGGYVTCRSNRQGAEFSVLLPAVPLGKGQIALMVEGKQSAA